MGICDFSRSKIARVLGNGPKDVLTRLKQFNTSLGIHAREHMRYLFKCNFFFFKNMQINDILKTNFALRWNTTHDGRHTKYHSVAEPYVALNMKNSSGEHHYNTKFSN